MTAIVHDPVVLKRWQKGDFWRLAVDAAGKCSYCDLDGSTDHRILEHFELDHLIPLRVGGSDRQYNRVFCCRRCNRDKGDYDPGAGVVNDEFTNEQKLSLIFKVREYLETRRSPYYRLLQEALQVAER